MGPPSPPPLPQPLKATSPDAVASSPGSPPAPSASEALIDFFISRTGGRPEPWRLLPVEYPVTYFFYGTLMQPEMIKRLLALPGEPVLRPAKIHGWAFSHWGSYKTLVPGAPGDEIVGVAFDIQSAAQEAAIARYETGAYRPQTVRIVYTNEPSPAEGAEPRMKETRGKTFVYAGDPAALQERRFDTLV